MSTYQTVYRTLITCQPNLVFTGSGIKPRKLLFFSFKAWLVLIALPEKTALSKRVCYITQALP
ncbi:hypothetical protein BEI67_19005 [Photobacterium damselae subsp. piscicida]|nr:hypothetical protein BEI67_19005 [Photobacterium damselae subsp. piscicida]